MLDQLIQTTKPELLIINELQVNSTVRGWLFAVEVQTRTAKNGNSYLHLKLRDQRGSEITALLFDPPHIETLIPQGGKVLLLEGLVEEYRNQVQVKLVSAKTDESVSVDLFILSTRRPLGELEADFRQLIDKVEHPGLSELLHSCFTLEVMSRFHRWPAAVSHHGAVVGGLLEHTVNVTIIAEHLAKLYPCNQDLVLAGALLHDIGKLEELEEQIGAGFTPMGRMVGHIVLGMQHVQEHTQQIAKLDEAMSNDLLHIILAHHGTKEFGSPVCPATIEALIVHQSDTAEAKLTGFLDHCERNASADGWTAYNANFGGQVRLP